MLIKKKYKGGFYPPMVVIAILLTGTISGTIYVIISSIIEIYF